MVASSNTHGDGTNRRLPSSWLAAAAVGVLVIGLLIYAFLARPISPPEVGELVPGFQLTAINGGPMVLGRHRGEVVVINVFASWCEPCRQEAPDLEQTWREYRDQGVQFFGIAFRDVASKAQAFLEEFDVSYPFAVETNNSTARSLGVTGVPETFVVDQDGRLFHHYIGPVSKVELSTKLDLLLAE